MKNNCNAAILFCAAACVSIFLTSCELGVNPLLFDGSPVTANFTVSTSGSLYSDSTTIFLHDVLSGIQNNVDSISVINVSLLVDGVTSPTVASTTISGTGSIDGRTLLTLRNVPLSAFASERSIFDPKLTTAGVTYGSAGVGYMNGLLKHPDTLPASVTVTVNGNSSQSGLYFKVHVKLYTQVFTTK